MLHKKLLWEVGPSISARDQPQTWPSTLSGLPTSSCQASALLWVILLHFYQSCFFLCFHCFYHQQLHRFLSLVQTTLQHSTPSVHPPSTQHLCQAKLLHQAYLVRHWIGRLLSVRCSFLVLSAAAREARAHDMSLANWGISRRRTSWTFRGTLEGDGVTGRHFACLCIRKGHPAKTFDGKLPVSVFSLPGQPREPLRFHMITQVSPRNK